MKDHEREFIEEEVKLPFEQVAALITTIRILAEDDDEDAKDRRIRLTYLLVLAPVIERFDKFIDSLYNGGRERAGKEEQRDMRLQKEPHRHRADARVWAQYTAHKQNPRGSLLFAR